MLQQGTSPNDVDADEEFPLLVAIDKGYTALARELIRHGADIRNRDAVGREALHLAAERENVELVRELIAKGADVNTLTNSTYGSKSPLMCAISRLLPYTKLSLARM